MTKYIVHKGTGTIIAVDECVIVDVPESVLDEIVESGGDDYFEDEVILDLAVSNGVPINTSVSSEKRLRRGLSTTRTTTHSQTSAMSTRRCGSGC